MGKKGCEGVFSFCYVADGARLSGAAMPAIFLATLYEYSPLFYITVVSICFVVTCGIVLGCLWENERRKAIGCCGQRLHRQQGDWLLWTTVQQAAIWLVAKRRGLDVPVILRNSAETASNTFICKKQMQEVKNPFGLEIVNPDTATLAKGVTLRPHCLEKCILSCYWGCSVQKVQEALQKHVYCFQIQTPGVLEDALYSEYLHKEQHIVPKQSKEEILIQLPEDNQIEDFGPVPRTRYPLVALLTMADVDDREFIQLYMSVSDNPSESVEAVEDNVSMDKELLEKLGISEEELQESSVKDCVVCQNDSVNWVLLPCRHVCLCDGCLMRFQHCPICRHFVQETFPLRSRTPLTE
ncbi:cell growth regulator with RING finger domain protein 1 isoform X2 [Bufo gargarizans]|uniref:cell growth regulator with RING finger domain protein 1 isoform X2 n=1 Tax=Bufo gargarizans TaxID=30331 RepID=UPI001CF35464|nr:cell growth regulator with RING finger domain protein 1 isoform X2 [Bufo gargarizans]